MRARLVSTISAAALAVAHPGWTQVPTPPAELARTLAGACSADSAFGEPFGRSWTGATRARLSGQDPLVVALEYRATARSQQLFEVTALASFEQVEAPVEDLQVAAMDLMDSIEAAIVADGRGEGQWSDDDEAMSWSLGETGVRLELSMAGRVGVYVTCIDPGLEALHFDEAQGRTRVGRPTPPTLALPPRPEPGLCADPEGVQSLNAGYVDSGMAALDYGSSGSRYAEHLAEWYGQQMVDKGAWTAARKAAFLAATLQDPAIMGEFGQQMPRLEIMLTAMADFVEAEDTHDAPAACAAAVKGLNAIHDIVASNERQWARMHDRYRVAADRAGITLEE
ncbi:MAG: hypothetical protein ACOH1E_03640 [Brevundimonas sp.]